MFGLFCFVFGLFSVLPSALTEDYVQTQPEQIHLSLGVSPRQMIVTWVTLGSTTDSVVEFGPAPNHLNATVMGSNTIFTDEGSEKRIIYIHRALLDDLIPGQTYFYHCGGPSGGWSDLFWFTAMTDGTDWSPRFAIYGDLGNVNGVSIPFLQERVSQSRYDAVFHVGDFAYNMDDDNGRVGDDFMRQVEPIAAYVPYMTVVGNHEAAYNFSHYDSRFSMVDQTSGDMNNYFYSFDVGPVHVIGISTEFYFYVEYGWAQMARQFQWLENDLKEANKPENRALRPWIITMGHRPMYCSTDDSDDCSHKESIIRKGIPIVHAYGLEDLFYKYGVDVEIWAHEHMYERMFPVYDRKVYNGSVEKPYTNPKAPVHIITGSAGCQEYIDHFIKNPPEWSAVRISDYGYTEMTVHNKTHLSVQQISTDQSGAIVDEFTIVKEVHGPQAWL